MSDEAALGGGAHADALHPASPALKPRLYSVLSKLERPRVRTAVLVLSLVLVAPSLFAGFALDDLVLLAEQRDPDSLKLALHAPFDLFRWATPANVHALIDGGGFAWWTSDQLRMAFMRPLSSLTHAVDYWLWPDNALAMHLHNLLWFALVLAATAFAYSKLLGRGWTFGVALAMFAFDVTHATPVGWIAARNALVSAAFATLSIAFHHQARVRSNSGQRAAMPMALAIATFVLSVLGGELGYSAAGYFVAYAVLYDRGSLRSRVLSLLPYGIVLAGCVAIRVREAYGVGGGFVAYVDPVHEPARFLRLLPVRIPLLFASEFLNLSADLHGLTLAANQPFVYAFALALCVISAWFIAPTLREDRMSRFLVAGALLSAFAVAGGVPSDRLLMSISFGSIPVLAESMRRALDPNGVGMARVRVAAAGVFALLHLGLDPLILPISVCVPAFVAADHSKIADALPIDPAKKQTVIITGLPAVAALYALATRSVERRPNPERLYWLLGAGESAQLTRMSSRVLRVTSHAGIFNTNWEDRTPDLPLHAGERVELTDLTVTINEVTPDGRPTNVDFEFHQPLESDSYVWLNWSDAKLERYAPPREIGASDEVRTARF